MVMAGAIVLVVGRRAHPLKFKSNDSAIEWDVAGGKKKEWTGPGARPNSNRAADNGDVTQRALLVTSHGPWYVTSAVTSVTIIVLPSRRTTCVTR